MEQIQDRLRCAGQMKQRLAANRAMEKAAQRPQLLRSSELEPTESQKCHGSGGAAGLARLVGNGKRKHKKASGGTDGVMLEGQGVISDLNIPIVSGIARIFGLGKGEMSESESDHESEKKELKGGARHQGERLAKHLAELHGAGFLDDFAQGFMSVIKPAAGVLSMLPGPIGTAARVASGVLGAGKPRRVRGGNAPHSSRAVPVVHASMEPAKMGLPGGALGGQDVPPGAVAPVGYGNPPQAPAEFKRNTVGMGRAGAGKRAGAGGAGAGKRAGAGGAGAGMAGAGGKRAERGAKISKLMREHGMSLGAASKYLKEHPDA